MRQAKRGKFEKFNASGLRVGIVTAQFNHDITERLLAGAVQKLKAFGVKLTNIKVCQVPGAVEIPLILKKLAVSEKYDCLIALGAVIRGDTPHFDYVCKIVSEGVLRVMLDHGIPVGFGVLTVNDHKQAKARMDAGAGAAEAALQSVKVIRTIN